MIPVDFAAAGVGGDVLLGTVEADMVFFGREKVWERRQVIDWPDVTGSHIIDIHDNGTFVLNVDIHHGTPNPHVVIELSEFEGIGSNAWTASVHGAGDANLRYIDAGHVRMQADGVASGIMEILAEVTQSDTYIFPHVSDHLVAAVLRTAANGATEYLYLRQRPIKVSVGFAVAISKGPWPGSWRLVSGTGTKDMNAATLVYGYNPIIHDLVAANNNGQLKMSPTDGRYVTFKALEGPVANGGTMYRLSDEPGKQVRVRMATWPDGRLIVPAGTRWEYELSVWEAVNDIVLWTP